jgi:tetratricopeptide (TPR) repeat protein
MGGLAARVGPVVRLFAFYAFLGFGHLLNWSGLRTAARRHQQRALRKWPDRKVDILTSLASLEEAARDYSAAVAYYEQAAALEPDEGLHHCDLGRLYEKSDSPAMAIEHYRKGLALGTDLSEAFRKSIAARVQLLEREVTVN